MKITRKHSIKREQYRVNVVRAQIEALEESGEMLDLPFFIVDRMHKVLFQCEQKLRAAVESA